MHVRPPDDARRLPRRNWLKLTLVALLVSLAGLVAVTVQFTSAAEATARNVARQAVLSKRLRDLQAVLVSLVDAETGQRGYLLTGNPRYLAPYTAAVARLPLLMRGLEDPGADDARLDQRAEDARLLIGDKLAELAETVRLQAAGQHGQAMALVLSDKGQDDMERARADLADVLDIVGADRDRLGQEINGGVARIRRLLMLAVSSLVVFVALGIGQAAQALGARTRFQQALALSEQRHRALVEDQSEFVSLAREDGTLVYVNPAFARHIGRSPAELVGANRFELFDEAARDTMRSELGAVLRTGRERRSESRMQAADGRERWVSWTNRRRLEADGALLHSVGRDVTERKQAERALRASQAFLHRTGRLAGIGGWEQDIVTNQGVWSEEVRRILEAPDDYRPTRAELVASYAPEARAVMDKAISDCIEHGVPWDMELPRDTCTGRRIWVRTVAGIDFENGQPRRIVGALQDITERKQLEQRLAESERFLRQITDSLAIRIAYIDTHSRYRFVNLAHCVRYGRERDKIIGRTRSELTRGQTDGAVAPHIAAVLRGEPQRFEYEERVDGRVRRVDAHLLPDVGEDGRVRGFYTTGVDITERVAAERRLRDITRVLELSPDFVAQTDRLGAIQYMNPALRAALGLGRDEPIESRRFSEFNTPRTNELYATEILEALRERGSWLGESTMRLTGDRIVPVNHLVIAHRDPDGCVEGFSAVMRDISGEVEARNELLRRTATLQTVMEAVPATVTIIGRDTRYRFVNSTFERWSGLGREALLGRPAPDFVDAAEYRQRAPWIARVLAGEQVSFEVDDPKRPTPHMRVTYVPLLADGMVDAYVSVGQDITPHKQETGRLLELAQRDALTGLLNRFGLEAWLTQQAGPDGDISTLALLYVDLDHFKPVNDTFGHTAGDAVLKTFADRLREVLRPADAVARIGGDEFAVALAGVRDVAHAQGIAVKIIAEAARPFTVGALDMMVGASIGIAFRPEHGEGWQSLVELADERLYEAKAAGRGTFA